MKILVLIFIILVKVPALYAQRCEVVSMDHFGGDGPENVTEFNWTNPDGSFNLVIFTTSVTGSILTGCTPVLNPTVLRTYDAGFNGLLNERCLEQGTNFRRPPHHVYPRGNNERILLGHGKTPSLNWEVGIERWSDNGMIWGKYYGGSGGEAADFVAEAKDGGFFIASRANSDDGDVGFHHGNYFLPDTWVLRVDSNGDKMWSTVIGGTGEDIVCDIKASADGGCYVFGGTNSSDYDATGSHGGTDLHIVKLDSLGNKQWHRCLGGSGNDGSAYDLSIKVLEDGQGGFYILNRTNSQDGDIQRRMPEDDDFWLLHVDSLANILWENTYGGPHAQYPTAFCRSVDGSFWMGGTHGANGLGIGGMVDVQYGSKDGWVVHADSMGNFINQRMLGTPRQDELRLLQPLSDGTVLAIGLYLPIRDANSPRSPGFPINTEGHLDVFLARLGPNTVVDTGIVSLPEIRSWQVYPNPAGSALQLKTPTGETGTFEVTIQDAAGKRIFRQSFRSTLQIDTSHWPAGAYHLQVLQNKTKAWQQKVVIVH
jgi:hypothetical protein